MTATRELHDRAGVAEEPRFATALEAVLESLPLPPSITGRKLAAAYPVSMGGQPAIGRVSIATWANLPQRARGGWLDAVRSVLPERASRKC